MFSFSIALERLKNGDKLARQGWNGKGAFIFLVQGSTFKVSRPPLNQFYPEGTTINYRPHIDIKNVDETIATWFPSSTDIMADDWIIV